MALSNREWIIAYCFAFFFLTIAVLTVFSDMKNISGHASSQSEVRIVILTPPFVNSPDDFNISINHSENKIEIEWSYVEDASGYRIYYSKNLSAMRDINTSYLDPQIDFFDTSYNNWTILNNNEDIVYYYRVASLNSANVVNVSKRVLAKITYPFVSSSDGDKQYNIFSLVHDKQYNFSSYLISFCDEYPDICDSNMGVPTIQTIDRSDPESQPWKLHFYAALLGAGYDMNPGGGYLLSLNKSYNKTEVGVLDDLILINLTSSSDGDKQYNLFGDNYIENETFSDYLEKICSQQPQVCDSNIGIPAIQAIDRSDPESQPWKLHFYGALFGADYKMRSGEGYLISVNESIGLILNNTVIQ